MNTHRPLAKYAAILPIVDQEIRTATKDIHKQIACKAGCSHCCHVLVEVVWEEALNLGVWLNRQPKSTQTRVRRKLLARYKARKNFFESRPSTKFVAKPTKSGKNLSEPTYNRFFKGNHGACPFLHNSKCEAYEARPVSCRLHLVTSPASSCMKSAPDHAPYHLPKEIDKLRKKLTPKLQRAQTDGRWGELSVMVTEALAVIEETDIGNM